MVVLNGCDGGYSNISQPMSSAVNWIIINHDRDPNSETMSTGGKSIGIPIKLLHEAEGHTITLDDVVDVNILFQDQDR